MSPEQILDWPLTLKINFSQNGNKIAIEIFHTHPEQDNEHNNQTRIKIMQGCCWTNKLQSLVS